MSTPPERTFGIKGQRVDPLKVEDIGIIYSTRIYSQKKLIHTEQPPGDYERFRELVREANGPVRTYVITHGFTGKVDATITEPEEPHKEWIPKMVQDIRDVSCDLIVIITVDWSNGAKNKILSPLINELKIKMFGYEQAAINTERVGKEIAGLLYDLKDVLQPDNVHLIGFSLGAHVMGFAGKEYHFLSDKIKKLGRITGLDPAGPLFDTTAVRGQDGVLKNEPVPPGGRLDEGDANFVDIIHTNAGVLGMSSDTTRNIGHADFRVAESKGPKWGTVQPGCKDISGFIVFMVKTLEPIRKDETEQGGLFENALFMSHYRAHVYFRHSIRKRDFFVGSNINNPSEQKIMGFYCTPDTRGKFNVPLTDYNLKALEQASTGEGASCS